MGSQQLSIYNILIEQTQLLLVTAATVYGKQSASVVENKLILISPVNNTDPFSMLAMWSWLLWQ